MVMAILFRTLRRATAAVPVLGILVGAACAPLFDDGLESREALKNSLAVADAALRAGQPAVARRLYLSLAERFDDAPEPALGLAYVALGFGNFADAERRFIQAAERADEVPETRAEAMLGAGRAALARARTEAARRHFAAAGGTGGETPSSAWISNGLAIAASLDGDHETAEAHYREALRNASDHPWIAANRVRSLVAAGWIDEAILRFAEHDESYWANNDFNELRRLVASSRAAARGATRPGLALRIFASRPPSVERAEMFSRSGLLLRATGRTVRHFPQARVVPAAVVPATLASGGPVTVTLGKSRRLPFDGVAATVSVASPEIADVQLLSPRLLHVVGKAIGQTTVVVLRDNEKVQEWSVRVAPDLEPLRAALAEDAGLRNVRARFLSRGATLSGEVASAAAADRAHRLAVASLPDGMPIENELRITDSQQVNLEVQIAEVQRSISEDLGMNWEAFRNDASGGFRVGRLIGPDVVVGAGAFAPTTVDGTISPSAFFRATTGNTTILGMIDVLAKAGLANVLARPNVTAISGKPASFFSGGEYPLPSGYDDGVIVFEYKKFGVLLDFIPTVIESDRISLTVRPEVSEPSLSESISVVAGVEVPVINVRRAETTVEVGDGESIVIAGLFRNAANTVETGVPGLKDVPLLNLLFGHTSIRSDELELIVVVTARLVRPGVADDVARAEVAANRVRGFYY